MSMTKREWAELDEHAVHCAMQFIQDAGYECTYPTSGRHEWGGLEYEYHFEARKGPYATRKTPVVHLVVRVRCTGPNHKTLRPSFVLKPADGTDNK
jgi:hypothetical protein